MVTRQVNSMVHTTFNIKTTKPIFPGAKPLGLARDTEAHAQQTCAWHMCGDKEEDSNQISSSLLIIVETGDQSLPNST